MGYRKRLSVNQYLNKITRYLYDLINDHRSVRRVWKIQINMHVNFILEKLENTDTGETRIYYVWSDNVNIMQGRDSNAIIREIFSFFYIIIKKT